MKKVKFLVAVLLGGKHYKKDSVAEFSEKVADKLIEDEFAEEYTAPAPTGAAESFAKKVKAANKKELLAIKADIERVLATEPGRKDALDALNTVTEAIAAK